MLILMMMSLFCTVVADDCLTLPLHLAIETKITDSQSALLIHSHEDKRPKDTLLYLMLTIRHSIRREKEYVCDQQEKRERERKTSDTRGTKAQESLTRTIRQVN
jgi:hypothetical protein